MHLHICTLTRCSPHIDIARNPRKCGESFAKAEVPKPSPSPHKLLPSGQVDESSPTCLILGLEWKVAIPSSNGKVCRESSRKTFLWNSSPRKKTCVRERVAKGFGERPCDYRTKSHGVFNTAQTWDPTKRSSITPPRLGGRLVNWVLYLQVVFSCFFGIFPP